MILVETNKKYDNHVTKWTRLDPKWEKLWRPAVELGIQADSAYVGFVRSPAIKKLWGFDPIVVTDGDTTVIEDLSDSRIQQEMLLDACTAFGIKLGIRFVDKKRGRVWQEKTQ